MRRNWRRRKLSLVSGKLIPLHQLFLNLRLLDGDWIAEWSCLELPTWKNQGTRWRNRKTGIEWENLFQRWKRLRQNKLQKMATQVLNSTNSLQVVGIGQLRRSAEEGSRTFSNFLPMPFLAASASVASSISHSVTDAGGIYVHLPLLQEKLTLQEKFVSADSSSGTGQPTLGKKDIAIQGLGVAQLD